VKSAGFVNASPTKQFFVSILTRDIELEDAVLDLLDNCLDGIWRSHADPAAAMESAIPYDGFRASIDIAADHFSIVDNCGGIPRDVAVSYAFRLGREAAPDEALPTIGMYGIGMKRAIFKMGQDALIETDYRGDGFTVRITPEWLGEANNWSLPIEDTATTLRNGTRITVRACYAVVDARDRSGRADVSASKAKAT